jgi:cation diffusion facilitator family transporter
VSPTHAHNDESPHGHGHRHGLVDPALAATGQGLWALKWSFVGLMVTALLQALVVAFSGSVALLADTIHNVGDAATAIPLGVAFFLARRAPTRRFPYGLGRAEDFAGLVIILTILASAGVAAWQSLVRLWHPVTVSHLGAVAAASIVGFAGNEAVAIFRIRVGRRIGSAALIADGQHARADGWTSLAVLLGAGGVWLGYPVADPIVGLLISAAIGVLVWQSTRAIVARMLDGVDPTTLTAVEHAARHVPGVQDVTDVRARWVGHRLHVEVSVAVPGTATVAQGHAIAKEVRHQLLHHLPHLGGVTLHVDPQEEAGEQHHGLGTHAHDGLAPHRHD